MPATVRRVAFGVRAHTPALRVNKPRGSGSKHGEGGGGGGETPGEAAGFFIFCSAQEAVRLLFKMEAAVIKATAGGSSQSLTSFKAPLFLN